MEITSSVGQETITITGTLPDNGPDAAVLLLEKPDSTEDVGMMLYSNYKRRFNNKLEKAQFNCTLQYAGMEGRFVIDADIDLTSNLQALLDAKTQ